MNDLLSMFHDSDGSGDWSMTRCVAALFAAVFALRLILLSLGSIALGWPDAFFGFAVLFAIPFKTLFEGTSGASLFRAFLGRLGGGASPAEESDIDRPVDNGN